MPRLHYSAALAVSLIALVVALAPLATAHARLAELSCPTHARDVRAEGLRERVLETGQQVIDAADDELGAGLSCSCELRAPAAAPPRALVRPSQRVSEPETAPRRGAVAGAALSAIWRTAPKTSPPARV